MDFLIILLVIAGPTILTYSSAEFLVIHAPSSVRFVPDADTLPVEEISNIILSTFGSQLTEEIKWNGLIQGNVFHRPKASVLFSINGIPDHWKLDGITYAARFNTSVGWADTDSVILYLENQAKQGETPLYVDMRYENNVLRLETRHPFLETNLDRRHLHELLRQSRFDWKQAQDISSHSQNANDFSQLFLELLTIEEIANKLKNEIGAAERRRTPDFIHFQINAFERVMNRKSNIDHSTVLFGELQKFIAQIARDLAELYEGNAVVEAVTSPTFNIPKPQVRSGRQLLQQTTSYPSTTLNVNLAPTFNWMYPYSFNIALWVMVVLILTTYGVSWCMWFMDPGRDSVIYRLTTQARIHMD